MSAFSVKAQWQSLLFVCSSLSLLNAVLGEMLKGASPAAAIGSFVVMGAGAAIQAFLFNDRFFLRPEDRKLLAPRRMALVYGSILFEVLKGKSFWERAGKFFPVRLLLSLLLVYALFRSSLSVSFAMGLAGAGLMIALRPSQFWVPVLFSAGFVVHSSLGATGANSTKTLVAFLFVGSEAIAFAWLQNFLEEKSRFRTKISESLDESRKLEWVAPLVQFVIATVLLYPLMPGRSLKNPVKKSVVKGANRSSSSQRSGSSHGAASGKRGGSGSGASGDDGGGSGNADRGGSQTAGNAKDVDDSAGVDPGETSKQGSGGGKEPAESLGDEQETAFDGNGSADGKEGASGEGSGAGAARAAKDGSSPDRSASSARALPKPKLKIPKKLNIPKEVVLALLLGIVFFLVRALLKKEEKKDVGKPPPLPVPDAANALQRLEERLDQILDEAGEGDGEMLALVVRLYNELLAYFAELGMGKQEHLTPDEYSAIMLRKTNQSEMILLTRIFCRAFYGKTVPSKETFRSYVKSLRHLARDIALT